jgi:hypothetical protein
MKPNGGSDKITGNRKRSSLTSLGRQMKEDFIQAGVTQFGSGWSAHGQGRQDHRHQDAERRERGAWRQADSRLRC